MNKLDSQDHPPKLVDFALSTLTEALQLEFSRIAESKGLALEVEDGRHCVRSDPLLIEQILRNLLSNAIKYTNRGKVSLRCASAAGSMVRIEVLDTGIGISTDELPHIFDEFYRSRAGDYSSREGFGLGLSIVQRISRRLNLEIDVHSQVNRGSSFSFLLPLAGGL